MTMESLTFYIPATVTIIAVLMVVTSMNAIHALLYLIISSISMAVIFYILGAPFSAALEVIVYAGAIMVLFLFVIMMLNLGTQAEYQERSLMKPLIWLGPSMLSFALLAVLIFIITQQPYGSESPATLVDSKEVGIALYGPYLLVVELASMLLMAGLIGAYHLGRPLQKNND